MGLWSEEQGRQTSNPCKSKAKNENRSFQDQCFQNGCCKCITPNPTKRMDKQNARKTEKQWIQLDHQFWQCGFHNSNPFTTNKISANDSPGLAFDLFIFGLPIWAHVGYLIWTVDNFFYCIHEPKLSTYFFYFKSRYLHHSDSITIFDGLNPW